MSDYNITTDYLIMKDRLVADGGAQFIKVNVLIKSKLMTNIYVSDWYILIENIQVYIFYSGDSFIHLVG